MTTKKNDGMRIIVNDIDLRVLIWRDGQQLHHEHPDQVLLGNHGRVPDRRNNAERVTLRVEKGDLVRVVVSAVGPITTLREAHTPDGQVRRTLLCGPATR